MQKIRLLALLSIIGLVAGCAVSSGDRIRSLAANKHFASMVERSEGFSLQVFSNQMPLAKNSVLNIYLEGDGVPWQFRHFISPDPTPRNPLMLTLMALDSDAAFYVGRPCYNGFAEEDGCNSKYWTSSRHAKVIVDSMAAGIKKLVAKVGAEKVNLFGFSGGGAMAMLIAAELSNTNVLVTLAGNLDLTAWTTLHGYSPLYGSLNPASQPVLDESIRQFHLMGEDDTNIPPSIVLKQVLRELNSDYYIFSGFKHSGPWAQVWPRVLSLTKGSKFVGSSSFAGEGTLTPVFRP